MEPELAAFMTRWGELFVLELKARLNTAYDSAPGYDGNAYQTPKKDGGRDPDYRAFRIKSDPNSNLYKSISYQLTQDGFELLMNDYWEYVNYGRLKGKYVPISPLVNWASTKGFPNPRSVAFAVSNNIQKFGISPTFFYDNAIQALEEKFATSLDAEIGKSIGEFFDRLLQTNIETK
jgi:hypothetical protein